MKLNTAVWISMAGVVCGGMCTVSASESWRSDGKKAGPVVPATATQPVIIQSVIGTVTATYPYAKPPKLLVTTTEGKAVTLILDPIVASMSKHHAPATLEDLKGEVQVKVEYTEKDGELRVKTLDIIESEMTPDAAGPVDAATSSSPAATSLPDVPTDEPDSQEEGETTP